MGKDWRTTIIEKLEKVVKHGWGSISVSVTKKGEKIAVKQSFDDIIE